MTTIADQNRGPFPLPRWWWPYFVAVSMVAVIGLVLGVVGIYANNRQDAVDAAENKARDEDQKALLDCFDDFASQLAGGLPAVREATAKANAELAEALGTLRVGLVKVGDGTFGPADLSSIIDRFGDYQRANDALEKAREENPYPAAPSTFCSTR